MKQLFLIASLYLLFQYNGSAQEFSTILATDQNPNYGLAIKPYLIDQNESIALQGTTLQETYNAIDPLEEKRLLRSQRREYRSKRRLWRHQEALEIAKNTSYNYDYYDYTPNFYGNRYYNNNVNVPVAIGLGLLNVALWSSCFW